MLREELLRKVRMIEISTRKRVDDLMSGQYKSHFKGQGVQFSEHRQYVPGDDIRHIDWKVSARSRDPLIKKYEEERELTVLLLVDVSGSEEFGSAGKLKSEIVAELGGMLAYAAIHSGDKVGALLFAGEVEQIITPKKGRAHIQRIIRDLLSRDGSGERSPEKRGARKPAVKGTNLAGALESAGRVLKHSGVIFVLSDFLAEDYEIPLKRLARKHDVVALSITDERELDVPDVGNLLVVDPETGEERFVDTASYAFRKWLKDFQTAHATDTQTAFKGGQVEHLQILTKEDYAEAVVRFFRARSRRAR